MKYKFLIIGILAVVLLIVAFVGYSYLFSKPDPLKLLNELYQKQSQIKKYSLNYSIEAKGNVGGMSQSFEGIISTTKVENATKIAIKLGLPGQNINMEYYYLPQGRFICTPSLLKISPEVECREVEPGGESEQIQQIVIPQGNLDLLKNLINKGIVKVTFSGTQKIIGRECYNFKFKVNVENFSISSSSDLKNITFFECLDKESGLPLFSEISFVGYDPVTGQPTLVVITTRATALSFDVGINKIELPTTSYVTTTSYITTTIPKTEEIVTTIPLPPEDIATTIKKFDILKTSCKANSNELNVTIKALENISGIARIIVESASIVDYFYPNKTVGGYNHYCFTLSNININFQLTFGFENINDSYRRNLIISIDCPEVEGGSYPSPGNCINCSKGKYCSTMETLIPSQHPSLISYTFNLNLPGTHEICVWPTSPEGYLWRLTSIIINRKIKLTTQKDIGVILENQTKVLNFVLPYSLLSEYYHYWISLTINNSTSISYFSCPYK
jgi:hypothetical protein